MVSWAVAAALAVGGCTSPPSTVPPVATASGSGPPSRATPSAAATTATPEPTAPTTAPLALSSVVNFRDVAGPGLRLSDGRRLSPGVVYRSAKLLTASRSDLRRLSRAGLALVIDLRTEPVARAQPDPEVAGARHVRVDLFGPGGGPRATGSSVADARAAMRRMNAEFVTSAYERARTADVLRLIASATGPVLIHCQAGKDRTGWISAVLLLAAGAERADVITEYLKSNAYRAGAIAASYRRTLAAKGLLAARIDRAHQRVEASYLGAALDELYSRYGTVENYLTDGLGLSSRTVERLRARLTG